MTYLHGVDRLSSFDGLFKNKHIGLITNPTGLDSNMDPTPSLFHERYHLTALYAPEHGIRGDRQAGVTIDDVTDERLGVPVRSLFGTDKPFSTENVDLLVYDIQDVGVRFYTYIYAMTAGMEAASRAGIPFVVLDRLDPLGLSKMEGTLLDEKYSSGVGRYAVPGRYALTPGEFAAYVNDVYHIGCDLHVVPCAGLKREDDLLSLGLPYVLPSPNLPSFHSVVCYVGTVLFEGTNISEGRGTARPFEMFGAPWLDGEKLLKFIRGCDFKGAFFRETHFCPTFSKYKGEIISGIDVMITDHKAFDATRFALTVIDHIRNEYPAFSFRGNDGDYFIDKLLGSDALRKEDFNVDHFLEGEAEKVEIFRKKAENYYLYR